MTWHSKHMDSLTLGQRAADGMRNAMGSWLFVGVFCFFMGIWIGSGGFGIDPSPFILLNLALSTLAGLQGAILLIAAKRQDEISASLAQHDYETNIEAEKRIEALQQHLHQIDTEKLDKILAHLNVL